MITGMFSARRNRLAAAGMGVNPVPGFLYDHLFAPEDRTDDAIREVPTMVSETGDACSRPMPDPADPVA